MCWRYWCLLFLWLSDWLKVFPKKEEMIRHFKWHKKREDSLQHGFMRYSPLDDCSKRFFVHCSHNGKHTHYHCLQVRVRCTPTLPTDFLCLKVRVSISTRVCRWALHPLFEALHPLASSSKVSTWELSLYSPTCELSNLVIMYVNISVDEDWFLYLLSLSAISWTCEFLATSKFNPLSVFGWYWCSVPGLVWDSVG